MLCFRLKLRLKPPRQRPASRRGSARQAAAEGARCARMYSARASRRAADDSLPSSMRQVVRLGLRWPGCQPRASMRSASSHLARAQRTLDDGRTRSYFRSPAGRRGALWQLARLDVQSRTASRPQVYQPLLPTGPLERCGSTSGAHARGWGNCPTAHLSCPANQPRCRPRSSTVFS